MNGSKRAADGGIAVTGMWANGLGRAAGKRVCVSNGRREEQPVKRADACSALRVGDFSPI